MKIKISIPQIRARNIMHPRTDDDEIYVAYFVTLAKTDGSKTEVRKYVAKKISPVKNNVWKGTRWTPENMEAIIDVGDAQAAFINLGLYERDNGRIYKMLKEKSDVLIDPEDFDWSSVSLPENLTDVLGWLKCLYKMTRAAFTYFMEDDLIGKNTATLSPLTKEGATSWCGIRTIKLKSFGGDYRVNLCIEAVE